MRYEGIEQAISEKTRATVATHLFGYPMDVHRIDKSFEWRNKSLVTKK